MMYLSQITVPSNGMEEEHQATPSDLNKILSILAQDLYSKGWTVIGSVCKRPSLHKWGGVSKEILLRWTLDDLSTMKANALNVRLSDSNVIAFDCDIYDDTLVQAFINKLELIYGFDSSKLYTVVGGKGCKIFFQYHSPNKPPCELAKAWFNGVKQMFEVKNLLSTVAGCYNSEYAVYHALDGTNFICTAAPRDLPWIDFRDIQFIKRVIFELFADWGYTDSSGYLSAEEWLKDDLMMVLSKFHLSSSNLSGGSLDLSWEAFCKLQGSSIYHEAIMACFYNKWPAIESPTFRACKDVLFKFLELQHHYPEKIGSYAAMFNTSFFAEYAAYLRTIVEGGIEHLVDDCLESYRLVATARNWRD